MTTLAIVVSLVGQAWAENANGERRALEVGDQLAIDETLIMEEGARVDLDFGDNQQLTFLGEQQVSAEARGEFIEQGESLGPLERSEQPTTDTPTYSGQASSPEGHSFVQLVRIDEIIEADGFTPVTVARIQEVLRPFGLSLPQSDFVRGESDENRSQLEGYRERPVDVDDETPGATVVLKGVGPDGSYNESEIVDGKVPGEITLNSNTEPGDTIVVTDGKGNELINRPVTQDDMDNGIPVDVPVEPGQTDVEINVELTDPVGNSSTNDDNKPVDNVTPTVKVDLEEGSDPDGNYNLTDTADGIVQGTITLDPDNTEPGDTILVEDGDGNVVINRPVTEDDINNGIVVDVPVTPGQTDVDLSATVTDPAGNSGSDTDSKPSDNQPPEIVTPVNNQSNDDAEIISLDLSTNFNDTIDGGDISYSASGLPAGLSIDPNTGIISGTIDKSASQFGGNGEHTVTITVADQSGNSADTDFTWSVSNPPPVAQDDAATVYEGSTLMVDSANGVLANDSDPDEDNPLVVTEFTVDSQTLNAGDAATIAGVGELTLNADGSYEFEPEPEYNGTVPTVTYTVADADGDTNTADLNITVEPVLDITLTASAQVEEGEPITVTASVENAVQGNPLYVVLDNGQTITIPVGSASGNIQVDSRTDDAYTQGDTTAEFEVVGANGGSEHINDSSFGGTASTEVVDNSDATTVSVSTNDVTEDATGVTFNFQLSNPPQAGETITLTVDAAGTEHTVTVDASGYGDLFISTQDSDVYLDPDSVTAEVTAIDGGDFEAADLSGATATAQITDTIDIATAELSVDRTAVSEGDANIVYTVTLNDENGNPVNAQNTVTVETTLGTVTIIAGESSGTLDASVPAGSVYLDGETITNAITSASEVNTGQPGSFEDLAFDNIAVNTEVSNVVDTTTLTLNDVTANEGDGTATITGSLDYAPETELTITLSNGAIITFDSTYVPNTAVSSTPFDINNADDVYNDASSFDLSVIGTDGGNFEDIDTSSTATVAVDDTIDTVTATLNVSKTAVEEGAPDLIYTVTLRDENGDLAPAKNTVTVSTTLGDVTIAAGQSSGILSVPVQGDDVYSDGETVTNAIAGITEDSAGDPGSFENLTFDSTSAKTVVSDTTDTVTAKLSVDRTTVSEGEADLAYTVTLTDANGNAVDAKNDVTVTLSDGSTITIAAGSSSENFNLAVQGDDVYVDGETISTAITDISEQNADAADSFENLTFDDAAVDTVVSDTIDPVYAQITVDQDSVLEGGTLNYTVNFVDENGDPVTVESGKDVTVNLDWSGAAANTGDVDDLPASVTITGGNASASFEVNTTADTTAELSEPVTATIESVVDNAGTDPGFENLQVDPGSDSATAQIVDAPTIEVLDDNGAADGQVTVREQGLDNGDGSNTVSGVLRITAPSGLETIEMGGKVFTLADIEALDGNQTITVDGHGEITLNGSAMVETANGQDAVWEVDFDYELTDAQTHTSQGADDALKDVDLKVSAKDPQDANNPVTGSGSLGVQVIDDVPEVDLTGAELDEAQVKEAQIEMSGDTEATVDFSGAFDINHGADGDDGVSYELVVDSSASGLVDTASGDEVVLVNNNGVIEGRTDNGSNDLVFTIQVDTATGKVTLTQNRALEHQDPLTPNDTVKITNGAIDLKATAKDGDGDEISNTVNIGDRFVFQDDGPAVDEITAGIEINEANLANGSDPSPSETTSAKTAFTGIDFGADGVGDVQFSKDNAGSTVEKLKAAGLKSDKAELEYVLSEDGHTLTAYRGGNYTEGNKIFTVDIVDIEGTPSYKFTLNGPLDHLNEDLDKLTNINLNFEGIIVTDGDGDSSETEFTVKVKNDEPDSTTPKSVTTDEDEATTFNSNADATQGNITIGNGDEDINGNPTVAPKYGTVTIEENGQLTYTPNDNYSGEDTFTYTTTTDSGAKTYTVNVTVNPVADAPDMDGPGGSSNGGDVPLGAISTQEDTAVALGLKTPIITDDGTGSGNNSESERLGEITLELSGGGHVENVKLTAPVDGSSPAVDFDFAADGLVNIWLTDADHPEDLTKPADAIEMTTTQYEGLQLLPAEHRNENIDISVRASSYEVDGDGNIAIVDGSQVPAAESEANVKVWVEAVTDDAELVFDSSPASGIANVDSVSYDDTGTNPKATVQIKEDTTFNLKDILKAEFEDLDGSEERSITIKAPAGQSILVDGQEVAAGDGVTIDAKPDAGGQTGDIGSFGDIQIGAVGDFSGDLDVIKITINAQDKDDDGFETGNAGDTVDGVEEDNTDNNSVDLNIRVTPVAGDVQAGDVETEEDTAVNFLEKVKVTDTGSGTEVINSVSFEVPVDWEVSAPTSGTGWGTAGDGLSGSYTITFDNSLSETDREAVLDDFTITPPAHSSADADIELSIETTDTQTVGGTDTQTTTESVKVTVTPEAEEIAGSGTSDTDGDSSPDLTMTEGHDYTTPGEEDVWFTLGEEGAFNLKFGWSNEDGKVSNPDGTEETFALLTPELTADNGIQTSPNGSVFRYSTNGDTSEEGGAWITQTFGGDAIEIPVEYLDTLQFLAPPNFSGQFEIKVQALTRDTDPDDNTIVDEQVSGESTLTNILIKPSADSPTTSVTARVTGNEDDEMDLSIRPSSSDPSETFNVTIDEIPDGAKLYYDGGELTVVDGKVVIEDFDASNDMKIQPPEDSNKPFDLKIGTESVDTQTIDGIEYPSISNSFDLSVKITPKGVADEADITIKGVGDQSFTEEVLDAAGGVDLQELVTAATLKDDDGSETLSFKIGNLPEGFSLEGATALGNGEWSFSKAEYDAGNIKITTPKNFNGTASFKLYSVTTEDDGDSLTVAHDVAIKVTPSPEATMNTSTSVNEDETAVLNFGIQHQNSDTDESITGVWVNALDVDDNPDFVLTYGANGSPLANGQDGVLLENGYYKLSGAALDNIHVKGSANWSGEASFGVRYEVTDPAKDSTVSDATEITQADEDYTVTVNPVTDQPTLEVTNGDGADNSFTANASGEEVTVNLNIGNDDGNNGSDYDGSETLTRILLENVPQGVVVEGADYIGNDQWLFIKDDAFSGSLSDSLTLRFTDGAGGLTNHKIDITVTTEDANNGDSLTVKDSIDVSTSFGDDGGSDEPAEIIDWSDNDFAPTEDTEFSLDDAINGEIENNITDNGFSVTLSDLPEGTQVAGMTATQIDGQTVWTASGTGGNSELQTLLGEIRVTPPKNWNSNDGPFDVNAKLTTSVPSGQRTDAELGLSQQVTPVSDAPEVDINAPAVDEGNDLTFSFDISNPADDPGANWNLVDGKLYLKLDDSDIEGGGTLSADGNELSSTQVSGVDGLDDGDYYVVENVVSSTKVGVTYKPNNANNSGSVSVEGWIQSEEEGASNQIFGQGSQTADINPVNSGYDFAVGNVSGTENPSQQVEVDRGNLIELDITDSGLKDNDGSESLQTVLLSNLPEGFLVYVGNDAASATEAALSNNAGGSGTTNTWLLGQGGMPGYVAIMPPQNWSGTLSDLKLQVVSGEGELNEQRVDEESFSLTAGAKADGLTIDPTPSFGTEGDIIDLNLNHELVDPQQADATADAKDESVETLTLEFQGLGDYAAFYADIDGEQTLLNDIGQVNYDKDTGKYTVSGLTSAQAETLGFKQAAKDVNDLQVRAQTEESSNGDASDWTDWEEIPTTITEQFGTTGDDSLLYTGEYIDGRGDQAETGGTGDTIQLRFGEDLSASDLATNLANIETLDLSIDGSNAIGDNLSGLSIEDVLNITDGDNALKIDGDGDDSVFLKNNEWTNDGSNGSGYVVYTDTTSGAQLSISEQITSITMVD